jgi:hypothetical protein
MRFLTMILLLSTLPAWAQAPVPTLNTSINGIEIGGLEYWPFNDAQPGSPYPNRVLWEHEEGSPKAQECMIESSRRLTTWLEDTQSPVYEKLRELKRRGGPSRFWMWTNDYTKAPQQAQSGMRRSHVWHWCSEHTSPDCGWLKFESTVTPDGVCKMPEALQVATYLQSRINLLPEPLQPEGPESANNEFDGGRENQVTDRASSPQESAKDVAAGRR